MEGKGVQIQKIIREKRWLRLLLLEGALVLFLFLFWETRLSDLKAAQSVQINSMGETFTAPFSEITGIAFSNDDPSREETAYTEEIGVTVAITDPQDQFDIKWTESFDNVQIPTLSYGTVLVPDEENAQLTPGAEYGIYIYVSGDLLEHVSARVYGQAESFLPLYLGLSGYLMAVLAVVYLFLFRENCGKKTISTAVSTFLMVLLLGIAINIVYPPLSVMDEHTHFSQAYQLSNQMMRKGALSELNTIVVEESQIAHLDYRHTRQSLHDFWYNNDTYRAESGYVTQQEYASYPRYTQLLPALGITAMRLVRAPWQAVVYGGRLMNLLLFAGAAALAVKLCPALRRVLLGILLFPMTIWLGSSYSYDSVIISFSMVYIAYIAQLLLNQGEAAKRRLTWKQLLFLAVVGMVMAPAKFIYALLLPVICLLPRTLFGGKRQKYLSCAAVMAAGLLAALLIQGANAFAFAMTDQIDYRAVASAEQSALVPKPEGNLVGSSSERPEASALVLKPEGSLASSNPAQMPDLSAAETTQPEAAYQKYTLSWILKHPVYTFEVLANTLIANTDEYLYRMVGGRMQDAYLPPYLVYLELGMFLLLVFTEVPQGALTRGRRMGAAAIAAVSALAVFGTFLFVFSTVPTEGIGTIDGVQGRYFIPILPLLPLFCQTSRIRIDAIAKRRMLQFFFGMALLCSVACLEGTLKIY